MRYWWVNQNQTFRQEIEGGYLWSPKRNKNGHRNPFYEFMREVAPGDIVFSFYDTRIAALGIVSGAGAGHRGMGATHRGCHRYRCGDPADREDRTRPGTSRSGA